MLEQRRDGLCSFVILLALDKPLPADSKQRNVYYVTSSNGVKLCDYQTMFFSWIPMVLSLSFIIQDIPSQDIPSRVLHIETYAHMFY